MASDNNKKYLEAQRFWSVDPAEPVKIRMGTEGLAAEEPVTIPEVFMKTAADYPDHPALVYEDVATKTWNTVTYK